MVVTDFACGGTKEQWSDVCAWGKAIDLGVDTERALAVAPAEMGPPPSPGETHPVSGRLGSSKFGLPKSPRGVKGF